MAVECFIKESKFYEAANTQLLQSKFDESLAEYDRIQLLNKAAENFIKEKKPNIRYLIYCYHQNKNYSDLFKFFIQAKRQNLYFEEDDGLFY